VARRGRRGSPRSTGWSSKSGSTASVTEPSAWTILRGPPDLRPHRLVDELRDLGAVERLPLEQRRGRPRRAPGRYSVSVLRVRSSCVRRMCSDLFVDHAGGVVGVVAGVHEVLTEEDRALRNPTPSGRPARRSPTPAPSCGRPRSRAAGRCSAPLDRCLNAISSAMRPPRNITSMSSEVVLLVDVALFDRQVLRHAEGHARREDRDLVHRVGVLEGRKRSTAWPPSWYGRDLPLLLGERPWTRASDP